MAASDTMGVFQYSAGARTRNVVNIANPGSGAPGTTAAPAYVFEDTTSAPGAATDGYVNFRQQKTLHVAIKNTCDETLTLKFWFYNSSLEGSTTGWYEMSQLVRAHNGNTLAFATLPTPTLSASGGTLRFTLPIDGVERIAVQCSGKSDTPGSGDCKVWLGVNTI
jgi:hypothetical protein